MTLSLKEQVPFYKKIAANFSMDELRLSVADTGVNPESIRRSDGPLETFSREAVGYFSRTGREVEFARALGRRKPSVDFSMWGGPHVKENLTAVLYELLDAGFSSDDISTLAFDILPRLYGDVDAIQGKSGRVRLLVDSAIKHNLVPDLLGFVARRNPERYERFNRRVSASRLH